MDLEAAIPRDVLEQIRGRRLHEVGFVAGPSPIAGHSEQFDPPAPLEEGLIFLEKYLEVMNPGHLHFDDGTRLRFERGGDFLGCDPDPASPL